jgi:hypothetical protein
MKLMRLKEKGGGDYAVFYFAALFSLKKICMR